MCNVYVKMKKISPLLKCFLVYTIITGEVWMEDISASYYSDSVVVITDYISVYNVGVIPTFLLCVKEFM